MTTETLLLRQVNPTWVQQGRITSQLFRPTPKDLNRPSVYDGDLIDAPSSHQHFTRVLGFESAGVVAVTVQECNDESLSAHPDPLPDFAEHAFIDFGTCQSRGEMKLKAEKLRDKAVSRDWQFQV
jgi:hypothetical protein